MNLDAMQEKIMADPNSGCWLWIGSIDGRGYGRIIMGGRHLIAHRHVLKLAGVSVPDGSVVCHKCDARLCVRPDHLFVGTQADNMRDMHAKGRAAVGERMPTASLTDAQVRGIRFLATLGRKQNTMARQYGVSTMVISRVVRRESWKHI
jgi:hypothetical protein